MKKSETTEVSLLHYPEGQEVFAANERAWIAHSETHPLEGRGFGNGHYESTVEPTEASQITILAKVRLQQSAGLVDLDPNTSSANFVTNDARSFCASKIRACIDIKSMALKWWHGLTHNERFVFRAGAILGAAGFVFGYDIGVVTGALNQLDDAFHLSSVQKGMVVSFLPLGTIIGCMGGGPLSDAIGRWKTIQIQNVCFVVGVLVISLATSVEAVYMGRFVVGIASALSAVADIPYLTEVSSPETRGRVTSAYEVLVVVGILVSFIVDLLLADTHNGWRWMFGIPGLFAAAQSVCMLSMPESPKWLLENNRRQEAEAALLYAYGDLALVAAAIEEHDAQVRAQRASIERAYSKLSGAVSSQTMNPIMSGGGNQTASLVTRISGPSVSSDQRQAVPTTYQTAYQAIPEMTNFDDRTKQTLLLTKSEHAGIDSVLLDASSVPMGCNAVQLSVDSEVYSSHRRAADRAMMRAYIPTILVLCTLLFFQQFTGGVVFRNYSSAILQDAGFSTHDSMLFTVILGVFKVCITCWSIYNIDRLGRKPLLMYGSSMIGIGMLMYMVGSSLGIKKSVALYVLASIIITGGYSLGYGPVCWLLQSEMFPALIRGRGMAISVILGNVFQFVVNLLFLPATDLLGRAGVFLFFTIASAASLLFIQFVLVETKEREPEEMLEEINLRLSCNGTGTKSVDESS